MKTMSIKKWNPWNWFKKEEEDAGNAVAVQRSGAGRPGDLFSHSMAPYHRELDRLFDQAFRGFGLPLFGSNRPMLQRENGGNLKPTLDLGATDNAYTVTVEIPGVDENDIKLEIVNDTLNIQGEKKQETKEEGKNFYRVERSYGSFRRVLSLPEDADQNGVSATFKKGVLTVTMPRKALPQAGVKQIAVSSA